ncbi:CGNR zinc finger domain-containing protein [Sphaerisporangium dianthi]|uniref:CGNR zinc finger domain-containing protein n=1 Tax=Sphaerisporangium dianthi TaxID=1436120 RepID=A0ABV9CC07_9ACTN
MRGHSSGRASTLADLVSNGARARRRRWCAMERCGNRHKLRALRARQATHP